MILCCSFEVWTWEVTGDFGLSQVDRNIINLINYHAVYNTYLHMLIKNILARIIWAIFCCFPISCFSSSLCSSSSSSSISSLCSSAFNALFFAYLYHCINVCFPFLCVFTYFHFDNKFLFILERKNAVLVIILTMTPSNLGGQVALGIP